MPSGSTPTRFLIGRQSTSICGRSSVKRTPSISNISFTLQHLTFDHGMPLSILPNPQINASFGQWAVRHQHGSSITAAATCVDADRCDILFYSIIYYYSVFYVNVISVRI